jgi:mannosyltransferase
VEWRLPSGERIGSVSWRPPHDATGGSTKVLERVVEPAPALSGADLSASVERLNAAGLTEGAVDDSSIDLRDSQRPSNDLSVDIAPGQPPVQLAHETTAPQRRARRTSGEIQRRSWAPSPTATIGLLATFVAGAAVLSRRTALWGDEAFSVAMAQLRWTDMVKEFSYIDVNMSLYHLLLGVWVRIFGVSELATRSLSIGLVALGLWRLRHLMRRLFDDRTGRLAVLIGVVNPAVWLVALTVRPYALLFVGTIVLTELAVSAIRSGTSRRWLMWAIGAVLLSHVHMTGTLTVAAHLGVALLHHRPSKTTMAKVVGVLALGTLPALIWLAPANTLAWLKRPSVTSAVGVVLDAAGGLFIGPIAIVAAVAAVGLLHRRTLAGATVHSSIVTAGLVVPFIIICVMFTIQSLFVALYFTVMLPSLVMLMTITWQRLVGDRRWLSLGACALAVAALAATLGTRPSAGEQDWRGAVNVLGDRALPQDAIVFPNTFYRIAAERESAGDNRWLAAKPVLPSTPWFSQKPHVLDGFKRDGLQLVPATIERELAGYSTLWLVGPSDPEMAILTKEAERIGFRRQDITMVDSVAVIRLTRLNSWAPFVGAPVP